MKLMQRQQARRVTELIGALRSAAGLLPGVAGALVAVAVSLPGAEAVAHHSGEMFEPDRTVTLTGTVQEFRYINPHSWLIVDIDNEDGTTTTWGFEAEGPQGPDARRGAQERPAARRENHGHGARPMRDGRPAGIWSEIVKDDGTLLNWRTPGPD